MNKALHFDQACITFGDMLKQNVKRHGICDTAQAAGDENSNQTV